MSDGLSKGERQEYINDYEQAHQELRALMQELSQQVSVCIRNGHSGKEHMLIWRRNAIQTLFSYIDGMLHRLRLVAYYTHRLGKQTFSRSEVAMMLEENYEVRDGHAQSYPSHIHLLKDQIVFSFRVYAQAYNIEAQVDLEDSGWELLLKAHHVRNRVTHPKNTEDLKVSAEEINYAQKGREWFDSQLGYLFDRVYAEQEGTSAALKEAARDDYSFKQQQQKDQQSLDE